MKKILLCSAAIVGVSAFAAPAMAQIDVTIGGHSKNYIGYLDQDGDVRDFDMLRKSELHVNAEGTADNGLVYGFHTELNVDGGDSANTVRESYLYLASAFGRVNLGSEDGANYLLQVAAPSADSNIDGLRQYINPVNYGAAPAGVRFDYANNSTTKAEKITYLSPNWTGFQFGVSYTPDVGDDDANGTVGFNFEDTAALEEAYEAGVRYEGMFDQVGFAVGAGYTHIEGGDSTVEDMKQWNVGADFDIGAFGVGAAYTKAKNVLGADGDDSRTWVLGADYTTGPFQFGGSYLNQKDDDGASIFGVDTKTQRYTGGVIYTLTQGLTLRGSISYIDHDVSGADDVDATSVMGGVQFNF